MNLSTRRSRESCEEVERTIISPSSFPSFQPSKAILGVGSGEKFFSIREIVEQMTVDELATLGAGAYVGWVVRVPSLLGIHPGIAFADLRTTACAAVGAEFTWGFLLPRNIRKIKQILTDESVSGGTPLLMGAERETWAQTFDTAFWTARSGELLILSISGDACVLAKDGGLVVRHDHNALNVRASKIPVS